MQVGLSILAQVTTIGMDNLVRINAIQTNFWHPHLIDNLVYNHPCELWAVMLFVPISDFDTVRLTR
jgi:hypothetical protein